MPTLLFDGVCNVCNASVNFVIDHDASGRVRLGALQSDAGQALLRAHGLDPAYLDSLVLLDDGQVFTKSDAALRLARYLDGRWPWLERLRVLPRGLRDALYDLVAKNRYRWFGVRESCRMPTPDIRARFIG